MRKMKEKHFSRWESGKGNVEDDFVKAVRETLRWGGWREGLVSTGRSLRGKALAVTCSAPEHSTDLGQGGWTLLDLPWSWKVYFFIFGSSSELETWDSSTHPNLHSSAAVSSSLAQTITAQLACLLTSSFLDRRSSMRGSNAPKFLN